MSLQTKIERYQLLEYIIDTSNQEVADVLDEEAHVFDGQYKIAAAIAEQVIDAIKHGETQLQISLKQSNPVFNSVSVKINYDSLVYNINAGLTNLKSDGSFEIKVSLYKDLSFDVYNENAIFDEIKNAVAHELLHAYFTLNKFNNSGAIDNVASNDIYRSVHTYIKNFKGTPDDLYCLAFSIYSTFGQELNAFVSQCCGEVDTFLYQHDTITIDLLKQALKSSRTYLNFFNCLQVLHEINKYNVSGKETLIEKINKMIFKYTYITNKDDLDKLLKKTMNRLAKAIQNCQQTALNTYYRQQTNKEEYI